MWASSLRIAVYISSRSLAVPNAEPIINSCASALEISNEERSKYLECAEEQGSLCIQSLDAAVATQIQRVKQATSINKAVLESVANAKQNCISDYLSTRSGLEQWTIQPPFLEKCSQDSIEALMDSFLGVGKSKNEALSLYDNFTRETEATLENIIHYTKSRNIYDLDYVMNDSGKSLQISIDANTCNGFPRGFNSSFIQSYRDEYFQTINNALSCTSFGFTEGQCEDSYLNLLNDLENRKDSAEAILQETVSFLQVWASDFANEIKSMETAYDTLRYTAAKFTEGAQKCYEALQTTHKMFYKEKEHSWLGQVDLTSLMSQIDKVSFQYDQFNLDSVLTKWDNFTYQTNGVFRSAFDTVQAHTHESLNNLETVVDNWNETFYSVFTVPNIMNNINVLENYDPPQYQGSISNVTSLDEELELQSRKNNDFISDTSLALERIESSKMLGEESDDDVLELPSINVTELNAKLHNFTSRFEGFHRPKLHFEYLFFEFSAIANVLYLADFMFRAYLTLKLCFKYWNASSIKVPVIDIRKRKEVKNPFLMSKGRFFFMLVTHPMVGGLLALLVTFLIISVAISIYSPIFRHYTSECIPKEGNGTFLGRNMYTVAYNFASRDGNSLIMKKLDEFDVKNVRACSSERSSTIFKYSEDLAKLEASSGTLFRLSPDMILMDDCLDKDTIQNLFQNACCGEIGYGECSNQTTEPQNAKDLKCPVDDRKQPLNHTGYYLSKRSCDVIDRQDEWVLQDAIFDCQALPSCDVTCNGPQKQKLRQVTKECSCMFEWFLHSLCLRMILSVLIFGLMNGSRVIFVDGLARVMWRRLHPGTFSVWATCDVDGVLLPPDLIDHDLSHKDYSMEVDMKSQIERNTRWFRLGGCMMMVGAVCMNICWIVLILKVPDMTRLDWFD